MKSFEPRLVNCVLLKSNWLNKSAYADKFELILEGCSKLSVRKACGRSLSHSAIGTSGCSVASPTLKWFLNVCIALLARFTPWLCGGTIWSEILCFFKAC